MQNKWMNLHIHHLHKHVAANVSEAFKEKIIQSLEEAQ